MPCTHSSHLPLCFIFKCNNTKVYSWQALSLVLYTPFSFFSYTSAIKKIFLTNPISSFHIQLFLLLIYNCNNTNSIPDKTISHLASKHRYFAPAYLSLYLYMVICWNLAHFIIVWPTPRPLIPKYLSYYLFTWYCISVSFVSCWISPYVYNRHSLRTRYKSRDMLIVVMVLYGAWVNKYNQSTTECLRVARYNFAHTNLSSSLQWKMRGNTRHLSYIPNETHWNTGSVVRSTIQIKGE